MLKQNDTKSIHLAQRYLPQMRGRLLIDLKIVLCSIPAVRIPGGLTPP